MDRMVICKVAIIKHNKCIANKCISKAVVKIIKARISTCKILVRFKSMMESTQAIWNWIIATWIFQESMELKIRMTVITHQMISSDLSSMGPWKEVTIRILLMNRSIIHLCSLYPKAISWRAKELYRRIFLKTTIQTLKEMAKHTIHIRVASLWIISNHLLTL